MDTLFFSMYLELSANTIINLLCTLAVLIKSFEHLLTVYRFYTNAAVYIFISVNQIFCSSVVK